VGRDAVFIAVGRRGRGTAAKIKIRVPRIVVWPAAGVRGERDDLFGGGPAWVDRLFWCWLDEERSGRLSFGAAAVCSGGDRDGGLLNLLNRHHPCGNEMDQDMGSAREVAIAGSPMSDGSSGDAK